MAPNLCFSQTFQPGWNANSLLPFRVTPRPRRLGGDQVIYACYCFRTFRPFRCFHRGNTHQFGVTFSPKESFQEISKILFRVYPGMCLCSASWLPALLTKVVHPFQGRNPKLKNELWTSQEHFVRAFEPDSHPFYQRTMKQSLIFVSKCQQKETIKHWYATTCEHLVNSLKSGMWITLQLIEPQHSLSE